MVPNYQKKLVVLTVTRSDRPDFPAGVIRSLSQADPFPCSVSSLGRTDLFKALEPPAYTKNPMATRNLIRAPGKRKISSGPLPLITSIQPRSLVTGYTPAIDISPLSFYTPPPFQILFMGFPLDI